VKVIADLCVVPIGVGMPQPGAACLGPPPHLNNGQDQLSEVNQVEGPGYVVDTEQAVPLSRSASGLDGKGRGGHGCAGKRLRRGRPGGVIASALAAHSLPSICACRLLQRPYQQPSISTVARPALRFLAQSLIASSRVISLRKCNLAAITEPAPLAGHVIGPALAAMGEVFAMDDQPLMQLAGEHRDAVHPRVMAKPMAGHADLAATGLLQGALT